MIQIYMISYVYGGVNQRKCGLFSAKKRHGFPFEIRAGCKLDQTPVKAVGDQPSFALRSRSASVMASSKVGCGRIALHMSSGVRPFAIASPQAPIMSDAF